MNGDGTIRRSEWATHQPIGLVRASEPLTHVFIHHTVTGQANSLGEFKNTLRSIERDHVHVQGWKAIAYNKLVTHKGLRADGRGWGVEGGATGGWADDYGVSICAVGNYHNVHRVTLRLKNAIADIIAEGILQGHLVELSRLKIMGHRQKPYPTACPGDRLMNHIPDIVKRVERKLARAERRKKQLERIRKITKRIHVLKDRRQTLRDKVR